MPLALVVEILKELVSRNVAAGLDRAREPAIIELDVVFDAALAAEREANAPAVTSTCPSRNVVRPNDWLSSRVLVVTDADQRFLEKLDDGGEHFLAGEPRLRRSRDGARANRRRASAKPISR